MFMTYQNETLYVEVIGDMTQEIVGMIERRVFHLIEDYQISNIEIHWLGKKNRELVTNFKRNYYHRFKGCLWMM